MASFNLHFACQCQPCWQTQVPSADRRQRDFCVSSWCTTVEGAWHGIATAIACFFYFLMLFCSMAAIPLSAARPQILQSQFFTQRTNNGWMKQKERKFKAVAYSVERMCRLIVLVLNLLIQFYELWIFLFAYYCERLKKSLSWAQNNLYAFK